MRHTARGYIDFGRRAGRDARVPLRVTKKTPPSEGPLELARRQLADVRLDGRLAAIAESGRPILAGPFLFELSAEFVFWIPFIRWFAATFEVPPERLVAVSRTGADHWYEGLCGAYVDLVDHYAPAEVESWQRSVMDEGKRGDRRTLTDITRRVASDAQLSDYVALSPSLVIEIFSPFYLAGRRSALRRALYEPLPSAPRPAWLPDRYVAVKAYTNGYFAATEENHRFLQSLYERLGTRYPVVNLSSGLSFDDHLDIEPDVSSVLTTVSEATTYRNHLAIQSAVIEGADLLVSNFGGFPMLAPSLGRRALTYYDETLRSPIPRQRDVGNHIADSMRKAAPTAGFSVMGKSDISVALGLGTC